MYLFFSTARIYIIRYEGAVEKCEGDVTAIVSPSRRQTPCASVFQAKMLAREGERGRNEK